MLWFIITTGKCNLTCKYCGGSFDKNVVPWSIKYSIDSLKQIIKKDPDPIIFFYGGEPLLNYRFIMNVMDNIEAKRWGIQTNGLNIKLLPSEYWKRFNVVLLSIDGREEITDKYRGKGVYKSVINSAKYLKRFSNIELIARMTVTKDSDIFQEVTHLLSLKIFDKIHWQLNVDWTERWDLKSWADNNYLPGVRKLLQLFLDEIKNGSVLKIIPFLGIISAYFFNGYNGPPCGAGYRSVAVTPDGRILSCPIAVYEKWANIGNLDSGLVLHEKIVFPECINCEFYRYCGGRCLYFMIERNWGKEGFLEIDYVTKSFIREVLGIIPKLEELIKKGIISKESLKYDPILDSTEVIP
ncbi:MAG: TIGR04084 family radical SAM/SPASM domain-containing protein [Sulfolobaceae archaeon]